MARPLVVHKAKLFSTSALSLVPGSTAPPVLGVVATTGEGIAELWRAISAAGRETRPKRQF